MEIHVVRAGDTMASIARDYGVPLERLLGDNQVPDPDRLVVGQTIVVRYAAQTQIIRPDDTLSAIARANGQSVRRLLQLNPFLAGETALRPGRELVIKPLEEPVRTIAVTGYAYPFVDKGLLQRQLPYLSGLVPFTYGIRPDGTLLPLDDQQLIASARYMQVWPVMHLSTLTEDGGFDSSLASLILNDGSLQQQLIRQVVTTLLEKGYRALDVDFEFIPAGDATPYARFISALKELLSPLGIPVIVALAPKTSAAQRGLLYEGHDYAQLGRAADAVLLMTYEWGYTYGPPMAVAPLPNVRQVVEYALSEIPAEKIFLGIPNYGYNWPLPYRQGTTRATSISNLYAVTLAARYQAQIQYDAQAQAPWFRYTDENGTEHEVWFEDARSIQAKLSLINRYGLLGAGYWNLMRPFPQNWLVLADLYEIEIGMDSISWT